jgi:effector-binding domain-containing protein
MRPSSAIILGGLAGLLTLIVGGTVFFYFRLGLHQPVAVDLVDMPEMHVVYRTHRGPYHKIANVIQSVEDWAKSNSVKCRWSMGRYLDDPNSMDHERLRSHGGCVVDAPPDLKLPEGMAHEVIPEGRFARGVFRGSPSMSAFKVYPKIFSLLADSRLRIVGPTIELYEVVGPDAVTTTTLVPVQSL